MFASALLLICIVMGTLFLIQRQERLSLSQPSSSPSVTQQFEKKKKDGEIDERAALSAADALLNGSYNTAFSQNQMEEYLKTIEKGDFSVVDPKVVSLMHFAPDASEDTKIRAYQSLTLLAGAVFENKNEIVSKYAEKHPDYVVSDPVTGTVYVSLASYMDSPFYVTLTMVNLDGVWKLDAHPLVETMKLLDVNNTYYNKKMQEQKPSGKHS